MVTLSGHDPVDNRIMAPGLGRLWEPRQRSYGGELRCVEDLIAGNMLAVEGGNRIRTASPLGIAWVVKPKA